MPSSVIGADRNLIIDGGDVSWCSMIPADSWICSGIISEDQKKCFDSLASLEGLTVKIMPPERFTKMWKLMHSTADPKWSMMLPVVEYKKFVKGIVDDISSCKMLGAKYYETTLVQTRQFIDSLERAMIDVEKMKLYVDKRLDSFIPFTDGFAKRVKYSRFATKTGRATVIDGPRILELSKEFRDVIVSRYGDSGAVIYCDFSAMEMRTILSYVRDHVTTNDIYEEIGGNVLGGVGRDVAKLATIACVYGMGSRQLTAVISDTRKLRHFTESINSYFRLEELSATLQGQLSKHHAVIGLFGRPVLAEEGTSIGTLINYFAQSTAVDLALLGFKHFLERAREKKLRVHPLFVVHDAVIIDIHASDLKTFLSIVADHFEIFNTKFPAKIEFLRKPKE